MFDLLAQTHHLHQQITGDVAQLGRAGTAGEFEHVPRASNGIAQDCYALVDLGAEARLRAT